MTYNEKKKKLSKSNNKKQLVSNSGKITKLNKTIKEVGGPKGPEPTRYGDWEQNGRCSDF